MIKYVIGAVLLLCWIFFVFISDLYMIISKLSKKVDTYQAQLHTQIMKKYVEAENKCGKVLTH